MARTPSRITIEFTDGSAPVVLQGAELTDPQGGCLFWNTFGLGVLQAYYRNHPDPAEQAKADQAQQLWDQNAALMTKPECTPKAYS